MTFISVEDLVAELHGAHPAVLLDVRREQARVASGLEIPGAVWRNPAHWLDWKDECAKAPRVLLYCAHGQEISQGLTAALRAMGSNASCLTGGLAAWQLAGKALQPISSKALPHPP